MMFVEKEQEKRREEEIELRVNICDLLHFFLAKHDRDYLNHGARVSQGNK